MDNLMCQSSLNFEYQWENMGIKRWVCMAEVHYSGTET